VEKKLPNGAQGWQEVAALYHQHSGELILWDHDDMKWHWVERSAATSSRSPLVTQAISRGVSS